MMQAVNLPDYLLSKGLVREILTCKIHRERHLVVREVAVILAPYMAAK